MSRIGRGALGLGVVFLLGLAGALPARAHGTTFFPPLRKPPTSPTLPRLPPIQPLPPPTGVPPPTTPRAPTPPPITGPRPIPNGPAEPTRPRTLAARRTRLGAYRSVGSTTWTLWWALHRHGLLPDRLEGHRGRSVTPRDGDRPFEDTWAEARATVARRQVLPFLLKLLDPKARVRDDVRASALLALGRCGDPGIGMPVIRAWLHDAKAADLVRESAALAMGLLRRTAPALRGDGIALDGIRNELLGVFDDKGAATRVRAFSALALGLLADQDHASAWSKDGRLVSRALWKRLEDGRLSEELTVAALTALGMQPAAGVSDAQRTGLQEIAIGKRVLRRAWSNVERAHALTAALRLGGLRGTPFLIRMLENRRAPQAVRRAVLIALGDHVHRLDGEERYRVSKALATALRAARDPLTKGLAHMAAGFLLQADLAQGRTRVTDDRVLPRLLIVEAQRGQQASRGFSAIALALAVRGARSSGVAATIRLEAEKVLTDGLTETRSDALVRGAFAVAVGVAGMQQATGTLTALIEDTSAAAPLRGYAAVALGQLGVRSREIERSLLLALAEKHEEGLRRDAALALALLDGRTARASLMRELDRGGTEQLFGEVVIALGALGDLRAVDALLEYAADDERSELSQALAVVALGRLLDPEPRPSLLRLTRHANYPARTESLAEAYSIL